MSGLMRLLLKVPVFQAYANQSLLMRVTLGLGIGLALLAIALTVIYLYVSETIAIGILASIATGLATGLGALPVLMFKSVSRKVLNSLLGGAAGVMLAATAFSLVEPGIKYGNQVWTDKGSLVVAGGMLLGSLFLQITDHWLPVGRWLATGPELGLALKRIWLFIIAVTIHNFPEGMAVGVSFGSGDMHDGLMLAIAIALQNMPEGLAVAMPLIGLGYSRGKALWIAALTGFVEPVGGVLGVSAVTLFFPLLPIGMGFAAGAMLFVIADSIIPETQSQGRSRLATFAVMLGFIVMMMLDNLLA